MKTAIETMDYFKNMIRKISIPGKTKIHMYNKFSNTTQFTSYIISKVTKEQLNFCQMLLFTIPWKLLFWPSFEGQVNW